MTTRIGFDEAKRRILAGETLVSGRRPGIRAQGAARYTIGSAYVMESTADNLKLRLGLVVVRRVIGKWLHWGLPSREAQQRD